MKSLVRETALTKHNQENNTHQSNPSTGTASTLTAAAAARERQREAASSRATPTHVVEDDASLLKVLHVGMSVRPYLTLPESYLRSEPQFIVESGGRQREDVAAGEHQRTAAPTVNGGNGRPPRLATLDRTE